MQYKPSGANMGAIYICSRVWPGGWTLHWKPKSCAWVAMKLNSPIYEKLMKKNKYIHVMKCIHTKLCNLM